MTTKHMKTRNVIIAILLIGVIAATTSAAEAPKMKMTTEIPESITTPDSVETRIGTLEFFDGIPTKETSESGLRLPRLLTGHGDLPEWDPRRLH